MGLLRTEFRAASEAIADSIRGFELSSPFRGSFAEPLDTNAARQTTFDRGFDEVRCEERERDGHIDLTHAAFLARGDLLNGAACTSCHGYSIRFEPPECRMASQIQQSKPTATARRDPGRSRELSSFVSFGVKRGRHPWNFGPASE